MRAYLSFACGFALFLGCLPSSEAVRLRTPARDVSITTSSWEYIHAATDTVQSALDFLDDSFGDGAPVSASTVSNILISYLAANGYVHTNNYMDLLPRFAESNWVEATFLRKSEFQTWANANGTLLGSVAIYRFADSNQFYTVPATATNLTLSLWGGGGAGVRGGPGGYTHGTLAVTTNPGSVGPGVVLTGTVFTVMVGSGGGISTNYGGGGLYINADEDGLAGGGRSAVWTNSAVSNEIAVAGGGGGVNPTYPGAAYGPYAYGGPGGGTNGLDGEDIGASGSVQGGAGGTASAGGAGGSVSGGTAGNTGSRFYGGHAVKYTSGLSSIGGGAGGGGYFGGGSGAAKITVSAWGGAPGGGGSGYAAGLVNGATEASSLTATLPPGTSNFRYEAGVGTANSGNGLVVIEALLSE